MRVKERHQFIRMAVPHARPPLFCRAASGSWVSGTVEPTRLPGEKIRTLSFFGILFLLPPLPLFPVLDFEAFLFAAHLKDQ